MLIAAFLDPKTFGILNDKDLKNAKKLINDKRKNFEPEIVKEVSKKSKTIKNSNLNSFESVCGLDLDNDSNNELTSIKNELHEYVSYVSQFTH